MCLATDADRFTSLSENMPPAQLARFLDRYFEAVFPSIIERRGRIVDVIGDAVLASWTSEDNEDRCTPRRARRRSSCWLR